MRHAAVIFDLGGVVLGSPLHAIARYEREAGIPAGFVNRVVVGTGASGAWSRLERGELRVEDWIPEFERECAQAGPTLAAGRMMEAIRGASEPRPLMVAAIRAIRARGLRVGALTNNWVAEEPSANRLGLELRELFHAFIESAVVGLRKPDPRIYQHACELLGVPPERCVYLDDLGINLKPAKALGMRTIKVGDPDVAIAELEAIVGIPLRG